MGLDATDREALESAIAETFVDHDVESPGIEPEHFARPIERAAQDPVPVEEYVGSK